jgi:hypothetical protein
VEGVGETGEVDADGRRLVVRNEPAEERTVTIGVGDRIPIKSLLVNDKPWSEDTGERQKLRGCSPTTIARMSKEWEGQPRAIPRAAARVDCLRLLLHPAEQRRRELTVASRSDTRSATWPIALVIGPGMR